MLPSHAEIARTLASGSLPADAQIACRPGPFPVRHITDLHGRILLLSPASGALSAALRPTVGNTDTALVIEVDDLPPIADAPSLGRVQVAGWAVALAGAEAQEAALAYAEVDPVADLLDVGWSQVLHRVEIAQVRLERGDTVIDIDPGDYAAATPDPLRDVEFDVLNDLADRHGDELARHLRRRFGPGVPIDEQGPRAVRLDRYGLLVDLGQRFVRLTFARPARDRDDLALLMHPVLCRRCCVA